MWVRLFVNDVEPLKTGDLAARYEEAKGQGYAPIKLPDRWRLIEADDGAVMFETAEVTFEFTGPLGRVYGVFYTDDLGDFVAARRFEGEDAPFRISHRGDRIFETSRFLIRGSKGGSR